MSYPMFTLAFAWLLVRQWAGRRALISVLLILCAAMLTYVSGEFGLEAQWALVLALPAPVAFGFAIAVLCTCTHNLTPTERMACAMLGAALGLMPLALLSGELAHASLFAVDVWLLLAAMALMTALVPQYVYSYAAPSVGAARAAAAGSTELPTMMMVGWLAFGEAIDGMDVIAALIVVAAVAIAPALTSAQAEAGPSGRILAPEPSTVSAREQS